MKKKIILVFVIILLSNLPPLRYVFAFFLNERYFRYSTNNGGFTFAEYKGRDTAMMYRIFTDYKTENKNDTVVYRLFWRNPFAFWRYYSYISDKRFDLPYMNWKEIQKRRGANWKRNSSYQDF